MRRILASALASVLVMGGLMTSAAAQTANGKPAARSDISPNGRMAMHVNGIVLEDIKQFIPDDAARSGIFMRMVLLAKQEAIGASCADYTVDQKRLTAVMMRTMRPISDNAAKDVATANLGRALRQYHTLLGSELAQFAYDPSAFCANAKTVVAELGTDPEPQSVLVLKPA